MCNNQVVRVFEVICIAFIYLIVFFKKKITRYNINSNEWDLKVYMITITIRFIYIV